ncbi:MAG: Protein tyrosine/serine phosphatase [Candidatus Saccharicenans subterraneus]|uniref:Protein tyrosine/serine phosphatase n=1 Tax=Candidatus Saccharicenans subterraneus TaxID=2508984 RepID=A0A3E2BM08_9BACT|nr:MAG: Protein tyrosine/serine phosphatase [Candidatus Saccharicenans subterraneum]
MAENRMNWHSSRNPVKFPLALAITLLLIFLASGTTDCRQEVPRPENWAPPVQVEGAPNLHKVSDLLYRCAQPTAAGFKELEKLGIRTVVNLRSEHSDQKMIAGTNLKYYEIPSKATQVKEADLLKFLQIVTNPEEGPYLVHCHHGADRTGLFVAVYRIVVQGWSREEAIREMQRGGFGFHNTYTNIIRYLQTFDPEKFRRVLSLEKTRTDEKISISRFLLSIRPEGSPLPG